MRRTALGCAREYEVVLDIPNLCVNRIFLKVDSVTATINLNARVANLVRVNAGAEVLIGRVDLTIEGVRAQALLLVDLDDVYYIVDNTLTFIDNHPEVVRQLGSILQTTVGAVGGLVGGVVRGLLLGTTRLASGETVQRLVDEATGALIERTLSAAGRVLTERAVGSVLSLPTLRETTNAAGQLVHQVRDQAGALIEYSPARLFCAARRPPPPPAPPAPLAGEALAIDPPTGERGRDPKSMGWATGRNGDVRPGVHRQ